MGSPMNDFVIPSYLRKEKAVPTDNGSQSFPSPFYELLTGAMTYRLSFPVDERDEGPWCDEQGLPITFKDGKVEVVEIMAVPLGRQMFRLAENPIFEPLTELMWGDEFEADETSDGQLLLRRVVLPKRFRHDFSVIGGPLTQGHPISNRIHELEGGWETVAGGLLTVTVPSENWDEYQKLWVSPKPSRSVET